MCPCAGWSAGRLHAQLHWVMNNTVSIRRLECRDAHAELPSFAVARSPSSNDINHANCPCSNNASSRRCRPAEHADST
eukprot:scaffold60471_cov16-Tisochrysis_lutea.AAC.3